MEKHFYELAHIETISGTAIDPSVEGGFRGFITIRAVDSKGNFMTGQTSPEETRQMALHFLETAEAAEQDRIVFAILVDRFQLPIEVAAQVVRNIQEYRLS